MRSREWARVKRPVKAEGAHWARARGGGAPEVPGDGQKV